MRKQKSSNYSLHKNYWIERSTTKAKLSVHYRPSLYTYRLGSKEQLSLEIRGKSFEAAVGAELAKIPRELFYWREEKYEVGFMYVDGKELFAIQVKSGVSKSSRRLQEFIKRHPKAKTLFILEKNFLEFSMNPHHFIEKALRETKASQKHILHIFLSLP